MPKSFKKHTFAREKQEQCTEAVSLLPHYDRLNAAKPVVTFRGHNRDTAKRNSPKMPVFSIPVIKKNDPQKWFVEFFYDVPEDLRPFYPRSRKRFKKYGQINQLEGEDREKYAEWFRSDWEYSLKFLNYNPFDEELKTLREIVKSEQVIETNAAIQESLSEEEKRRLTTVQDAFDLFIESREERKIEAKSITTYRGTISWLTEYFEQKNLLQVPISLIKHIHISQALKIKAKAKNWEPTTINKQVGFVMSIFNWLEDEDYILKNPSKNKFRKLKTSKSTHRWYDRDTAKIVKNALSRPEHNEVLRACQFTYWLLIRSKSELRQLRIQDIDRTLKRIRFTEDLSKNDTEQYRDYPEEFEQILDEMKLERYPKHYYVFGKKDGTPNEKPCSENFFSRRFKVVKDKLKLSDDFTIYGWKHTRVVHEMMKGTDAYEIMHMCRHSSLSTTQDYMRGFDISLKNVYEPKDLTF